MDIIHEIDGIKYVVFETEIPVTRKGIKNAEILDAKIKMYKGIIISFKHISSFWETDKVRGKFLIPEDKALEFSQSYLSDYKDY